MIDISGKSSTLRIATAQAVLRASSSTIAAVLEGAVPKGDALQTARIAATQAAKNTSQIIPYCHPLPIDFVLTTGGTGLGPRDNTREALAPLLKREAPGISEALRAYGQQRTPRAMLSRGTAGSRGKTVIVSLPGSSRGVAESLDALFPGITHSFRMIHGGGHPSADAGGKEN